MKKALRALCCSLALALGWLTLTSSTSVASEDAFKLIVHPSNSVSVVDASFVRAAYLKQVVFWPHGRPLRPVDTVGPDWVRERFITQVLRRTPAQLRSYWTQRIFSGTGLPPVEVASPEHAIAYVRTHVGAIAFIPASVDPQGTKVVVVRAGAER
jgi:hypothetical protein